MESQIPDNVTRADFMQKSLAQATQNGAKVGFNATEAIANLALTVVDLQKENKQLGQAIQMMSQSMGQLMEAHNRVAQHVERLIKASEPAPAPAPAPAIEASPAQLAELAALESARQTN